MIGSASLLKFGSWLLCVGCLALAAFSSLPAGAAEKSDLSHWLSEDIRLAIFPESTHSGPSEGIPPAALIFRGRAPIGYLFATSDAVECLGFASSRFSIIAGIDLEGHLMGARVAQHHEPIIEGAVQQRVAAFIAQYGGIEYGRTVQVNSAGSGGDGQVDAISSATISSTLFNQAILRSARKVAQSRRLGDDSGGIDVVSFEPASWSELVADGSIAHLVVSAQEMAVSNSGSTQTPLDPPLIDLYVALATPARVGRNLLGPDNHDLYVAALDGADTALLIMANGASSFIGSELYRSGVFDRIRLRQRDEIFTLHRKHYRHIPFLRASGAPRFGEIALLRLAAESGFDPTVPFDLELTVRDGRREPVPFAHSVTYRVPEQYFLARSGTAEAVGFWKPLWSTTWRSQTLEISILLTALITLSIALFAIQPIARRPRLRAAFRLGFLLFTLGWLGGWVGAQMSVVTVLTWLQTLRGGFSLDVFMVDPLNTILMGFVVVTFFVWGGGVFCGWLCPFGALQELLARVARLSGVRQLGLSHPTQRRARLVKYAVLLGLVGLSLYSQNAALAASEVEPFETAIVLRFARSWPYVLYAGLVIGAGLFVERLYCRFLCPLGAVMGLGGRARSFDWLERRAQCGSPCRLCERHCPTQAIEPTGRIDMAECIYCLDCQVIYRDESSCLGLASPR